MSQFHIFGLVVVLFGGLVRGSRVIVMAKFEPMPFLETLAKYVCNIYSVEIQWFHECRL